MPAELLLENNTKDNMQLSVVEDKQKNFWDNIWTLFQPIPVGLVRSTSMPNKTRGIKRNS